MLNESTERRRGDQTPAADHRKGTPMTDLNSTVIIDRTTAKGQHVRLTVSCAPPSPDVLATVDGVQINDGSRVVQSIAKPIAAPDGRILTHNIGKLALTTEEAATLKAAIDAATKSVDAYYANLRAEKTWIKRDSVALRATAPIHWWKGSGYGGREYEIGQTVRYEGQVVTVLSVRTDGPYGEDGYSVGAGEDNGTIHHTWARPATAEETAAHEAMEAKRKAEREAREAARKVEQDARDPWT